MLDYKNPLGPVGSLALGGLGVLDGTWNPAPGGSLGTKRLFGVQMEPFGPSGFPAESQLKPGLPPVSRLAGCLQTPGARCVPRAKDFESLARGVSLAPGISNPRGEGCPSCQGYEIHGKASPLFQGLDITWRKDVLWARDSGTSKVMISLPSA